MEAEAIWTSHDGKAQRFCEVKPDMLCDFTEMPFEDETFHLVVFDPPHLQHLGETSWMAKKYGILPKSWEGLIRDGVNECMRVLKPNGTMVFKWAERDISTKEVLEAIDWRPLFGNRDRRKQGTIWMCFIKNEWSRKEIGR